eukprot:9052031-Alexandrium_andersonii.AAC.1
MEDREDGPGGEAVPLDGLRTPAAREPRAEPPPAGAPEGRMDADYQRGRLPGTPGVEGLRRRVDALQRDRRDRDEGRSRSPEARSNRSRLTDLDERLQRLLPRTAAEPPRDAAPAEVPPGAGETSPESWQAAMASMASSVSRLAQSLQEGRDGSMLKLERKRPTIKMEGPESFMHEIVALENTFAEIQARTYRRRWGIFRPALEGPAKETVEVELERRNLTAEAISGLDEEGFRALFEYLLAYMERCVGLTPDKKAEIALAAMARVHMADSAGASGALQLIADYKHAYLLELRA